MTMNCYPKVNVQVFDTTLGKLTTLRNSSEDWATNAAIQHTIETKLKLSNNQYASFLAPNNTSPYRIKSTLPDAATADKSQTIEADYARYTDAPPPYTEKQYEGKSEDEQNVMRIKDYTKEISRLMGHQLVRGLKSGTTECK
jgi:hypothetical protein